MSDPAAERDRIADLYDRWAATYDSDENRTRDLAGQVLRAELADLPVGDVLELGCGTGRNTAWLAERARSLVAVDFSRSMLAKARERVSEGGVRFLEHDIRTPLPVESGSADLVVITLVLEHVEDLGFVFHECARALRRGGHLFVSELHPYRQWAGARARFTAPGSEEAIRIPAYLHEISEYVAAGNGADLRLVGMGEWRDGWDRAEGAMPRLLSLLFRRPT